MAFRGTKHVQLSAWANDRVLRDLAGKLTAEDMQGLFSPVPFGNEPQKSVLQQAAEPHVYAIWQSFISIDMDKQSRVLQKWEEHVKEQRKRNAASPHVPPEVKAMKAWAHISRKPRHALRRAPLSTVERLEEHILAAVQLPVPPRGPLMLAGRRSRAGGQVQPLQQRLHLKAALEAANDPGGASLPLLSSFHRLLAHGICEYHGLKSVSREAPGTSNRITHFQRRPDNAEPHEIRVSDVLFLLSEESMGRFGPAGTGPGANANDDFRVSGSHGRSDYENTHGVGGSSMLQPASGGAYGDWVIV